MEYFWFVMAHYIGRPATRIGLLERRHCDIVIIYNIITLNNNIK